ncbi:acetyl-CoA carboxylase, biotin carboxyl carrier protein [Dictyobacter alpinus]|uniref:Biotin carboxyl carrier protein of acetyl-CoA carboxylase n=1 Tax=Dictyobacter alpinus TaxID=2014873 RepID=A0A402B217_9CHLR|nr:biotin/lipoyl-containing protein [Dictyobacter alpinus]GCE25396.1 acetyl-CoA carboxylase, biotin carboxyl carrier protein [Dictyobacter alpinus]
MNRNREYPYEVETPMGEDGVSAEQVSVEQLQRLVRLLDESDISEIEIKRAEAGMQLVLRKAKLSDGGQVASYPVAVTEEDTQAPAASSSDTRHTITAPLVGIFHTWGKPKGNPLVAVGDRIKVGQLVGTIQSLNVINEVESTIAGRIVEILSQDNQAVEYGQQLMVIDSSEEA